MNHEIKIEVIIKKFLDFNGSFTKTFKVNINDLIGDFILKIKNENVIDDYSAIFLNKHKKFIGYDYLLNQKFNFYSELKENLELTLFDSLNYNSTNKRIFYPIIYFKNSMTWPPAENWNEGDPINLGQFLIWNGWGSGPVEVSKEEDNKYLNLIILKYLDTDNKEIKKIVNKYSYQKALDINNKDPLTNKILSPYCSQLLRSSILYNQSKDRPLLEIPINYLNN